MVTSWYDYPGALSGRTEAALLSWLPQRVTTGSTWLDVGAHYGYTSLALSRLVGLRGRVVAFEPIPRTAGALAETRLVNRLWNLDIVPIGLGPVGTVKLAEVPTERGMASPISEARTGTSWIALTSLDSILGDLGIADIEGVKIDVQGLEQMVLEGMVETLRRFRPTLILEFHKGVDRVAILKLLRQVGYRDGLPIESNAGKAAYLDNRSYVFDCGS